MKVSEEIFWNAEYSFLLSILANKTAYDNYLVSEQQRIMNQR